MRDDSAEILFQSLLRDAFVSSSGMGRDVYCDVVYPAFPLPTTASPTLEGAPKRLSWRVTNPNRASFHLLTVARSESCGPTRNIDLTPQPGVGLVLQAGDRRTGTRDDKKHLNSRILL